MMILRVLFVIGVAAVSFSPASGQQPDALRQITSPLEPAPAIAGAEFVLPLALDELRYQAVREAPSMRLTGFPVAHGWQVDLDLEQFDVLAADARIVLADGEEEVERERPDVVLLRGRIAGMPESAVFLSLSPHGSNGFIRLPQQSWIISTPVGEGATDADGRRLPTVIYELGSLPEGSINWVDFQCGTDEVGDEPPRLDRLLRRAAMQRTPGSVGGTDGLPCRRVRIAIDTDWQYTSRFGGNTTVSEAYIVTLMGAVSEVYVREVNTYFEIVYMRVWSSSNTPYSATTVNDRLTEFRSHWNSNMGSVSRHVAHMLTGLRSGAGGVAWLGQLCGGSYSYGASGYINGSFPYPIVHNSSQNWDLMVVAHEIGHNFNAPHTHDTSPPIDGCGSGDCSLASQGTIMSYCHTCSGGMSNIRLDLHTRIINERILPYLSNASCAASLLCPVDPGRCCLPTGGCDVLPETVCNQIAGANFGGTGTTCAGFSCPSPGACCLLDGTCVMVPEVQCDSIFAGTFRGEGVDCGEARCASAPMLWNNGPVMTHTGIACSGRDLSMVPTSLGNSTRGLAWSAGSNQRIADQFIIPAGETWAIDSVTFFAYDGNVTSPSYTNVRIQIWDGDPRDSQSAVVAGNLTTNRLTTATMTNTHRQWETQPSNCGRHIQQLDCSFDALLGPGIYWIDRTATASGTPWMPLVTFPALTGKPGGQGLQLTSGSWGAVIDAGSTGQDMPFILLGQRLSDCYANCDNSTANPILNVDDFTCFINEYSAAQALPHAQQLSHYANCDGSTAPPVLNVDDFTCFINAYAQGCP